MGFIFCIIWLKVNLRRIKWKSKKIMIIQFLNRNLMNLLLIFKFHNQEFHISTTVMIAQRKFVMIALQLSTKIMIKIIQDQVTKQIVIDILTKTEIIKKKVNKNITINIITRNGVDKSLKIKDKNNWKSYKNSCYLINRQIKFLLKF